MLLTSQLQPIQPLTIDQQNNSASLSLSSSSTRFPCIVCSKTFGTKSSLWHHKQTASHQKHVDKQQHEQQNSESRKLPLHSTHNLGRGVAGDMAQSGMIQSIPPPLVPRRMNTGSSLTPNRLQQQLSSPVDQSNITNYGHSQKL